MIDFEGLVKHISGKCLYIDTAEFEDGNYCFYDKSGDKVIQYMGDRKMFYVNSPAFAHKRPKRDLSELAPFREVLEFNFIIMGI